MNTLLQSATSTPSWQNEAINTGIVCGCLPAQAGIAPTALYHHLLAEAFKKDTGRALLVRSAWYSTLAESAGKALELEQQGCRLILFHIRPDPYLRLCRLLIRYRKEDGSLRLYFNRSATDETIREKIFAARNSRPLRRKNLLGNFLRWCNYAGGMLTGLPARAVSFQLSVISELISELSTHNCRLLIIGPPSRPLNRFENYLLHRLEKKLKHHFSKSPVSYYSFFDISVHSREFFLADGVHVSPEGHKRLAEGLKSCLLRTAPQVSA